ncbi:hypothetical protein P154DRAFT_605665 [Amniculicola lignicola CBS 123094]|uniref:Uncharacterized protein n=1 Tax=Amniculicola lignicola CBS 123094 TaxID=1392246 RepID=A0A6A5WIH8_9PLEO|nr:hypothetical protein P154DRAFT_605665 [Amniculicola lignicola CBS 123094]
MPYCDYTTDPNVVVCKEDVLDFGDGDFGDDQGLSDELSSLNMIPNAEFTGVDVSGASRLPSRQLADEELLIPDFISLQIDTINRTLAEVKSTVFDIRDPNAIKRLQEIGSEEAIASAIHEMQFTCCVVPEAYPDVLRVFPLKGPPPHASMENTNDEANPDDIGDGGYQDSEFSKEALAEFHRIQEREASFFPTVFKRATDRNSNFEYASIEFFRKENLETMDLLMLLAEILSKFPNLARISYVFEPEKVPARYLHLCGQEASPDLWNWTLSKDREGVIGAQIGLVLLLWSLSATLIQPKHLQLAVVGETYWAFCIPRMPGYVWAFNPNGDSALEVIRQVCSKVETLTLNSIKEPEGFQPAFWTRDIPLTQASFPVLRALELDRSKLGRDDLLYTQTRVSSIWQPTKVTSVTIVGYVGLSGEVLDFLRAYGQHLQTVIFRNPNLIEWRSVLRMLQTLQLVKLGLYYDQASITEEAVAGLSKIQQSHFQASARTVEIAPVDLWSMVEQYDLQQHLEGFMIGPGPYQETYEDPPEDDLSERADPSEDLRRGYEYEMNVADGEMMDVD